jgi:hypothetical protein
MRKLGKFILAVMLPAGMAQAQPAPLIPPQIVVTAEATVMKAPDIATVSLGVTTTDPMAAAAMKANSAALSDVIARLKSAGIEDRDLQTSNLQLNPNWISTEGGNASKISGYTANNTLSVRVRDLTILGAVLDAAINDGANELNGISFGHADPRPLQDEARKAAVSDAISRAKLLTDAAGVKLGRIVTISETPSYGTPEPMAKSMAMADAVPVEAGEVGVTASVSLVFELIYE